MDKKRYDILIGQFKKYPEMEPCDAVKLLYQAEFGGGHPVQDEYNCMARIEKEGSALTPEQLTAPYFEEIGGDYCRMNLSVLGALPVPVLGKMFMESAGAEIGSPAGFRESIEILKILAAEGKTGFSRESLEAYLASYPMDAPRPVSHSEAFVKAYSPAYRVVKKEYCKFLEVFIRISRLMSTHDEVTVAIDGQTAAGKTTLAELLPTVFECNRFTTGEFAVSETGEIDVPRFESEICKNLNTGRSFSYGIYDYQKGKIVNRRAVPPEPLNIIEGSYSMRPELMKYYELSVFMEVNPILQAERILRMYGEEKLRFLRERVLPAENAYIEQNRLREKCDILYEIR